MFNQREASPLFVALWDHFMEMSDPDELADEVTAFRKDPLLFVEQRPELRAFGSFDTLTEQEQKLFGFEGRYLVSRPREEDGEQVAYRYHVLESNGFYVDLNEGSTVFQAYTVPDENDMLRRGLPVLLGEVYPDADGEPGDEPYTMDLLKETKVLEEGDWIVAKADGDQHRMLRITYHVEPDDEQMALYPQSDVLTRRVAEAIGVELDHKEYELELHDMRFRVIRRGGQ